MSAVTQSERRAAGPLDFLSATDRSNPYPSFAALREQGPVALPEVGIVLGDHGMIAELLADRRLSVERRKSRVYQRAVAAGMIPDPERELRQASFLSLDPPDHTRLRGLVSKAFTRKVVANLEGEIEAITTRLLDAARDRGGDMEVVEDLAYPLPVAVICALMGVPPEDHAEFAGWSKVLASSLDPSFGETDLSQAELALKAGDEFRAYFRTLFAARRQNPGDDLVSGLVRVEEDGQTLTEDELLSTCILLLVAGHETTVSLIGNAVQALLTQDQWDLLVEDPSLAGATAEETLRWDPPVQMTGRTATEQMEVGGLAVGPGEVIMMIIGAANRDPKVFTDPDRFDVLRTPEQGANKHLAFGGGVHFCLGAPLARLEASVALREITRRVASPTLGAVSYKPNMVLRGLERLPLSYAEMR
ncbi:MAG TPA: cytochrome P450 [Mycobacteriales bacterium]